MTEFVQLTLSREEFELLTCSHMLAKSFTLSVVAEDSSMKLDGVGALESTFVAWRILFMHAQAHGYNDELNKKLRTGLASLKSQV